MEALPDIAKSSQASAMRYGSGEPNPLDDLEDMPLGASAPAASIKQPKSNFQKEEKKTAANGQESLEERKLRLQARSEALKKKKRDEEEAKKPKAEN